MATIYISKEGQGYIDVDLDKFFPCSNAQAGRLYRYIKIDKDPTNVKKNLDILFYFIIEKYQYDSRKYETNYRYLMEVYSGSK